MNSPAKTNTPCEVAGKYGLSMKTIYRAVKAGELPCVRINARVFRITEVDAAAWWLLKGMSTSGTTLPSLHSENSSL
ncbi:MAG: helix-turn-helix domain-containing protein [Verrucomicrobiota bacterium]